MRLLQRNAKVDDPLRRRLRAVHRRARRRASAAAPGRLVLLRQRRRGARAARRRPGCTRATASGGTATTGAPPMRRPRRRRLVPRAVRCTASTASACRCASNAPTPAARRAVRSPGGSPRYDVPAARGGPARGARRGDAARPRRPVGRAAPTITRSTSSSAARRPAASTRASSAAGARSRRSTRAGAPFGRSGGHRPGRRHRSGRRAPDVGGHRHRRRRRGGAPRGRFRRGRRSTTSLRAWPCSRDRPRRACRWRDELPPAGQPAARGARRGRRRRTASRWPSAALAFEHPLVLGRCRRRRPGRRGRGAGVGREVARSARYTLPLALVVAIVNALVVRDGLTVFARLGEVPPVRPGRPHRRGARLRRSCSAARVLVVILCCALFAAARRPRRAAARLPSRLLPLGADRGAGHAARARADARRPAHGRRPAPAGRGPAPRASRCCARSPPTRSTARSTSPPRSRCAATAPRAARARAERTPWSRHDLAFAASAGARRRARRRGAGRPAWASFDGLPGAARAGGRRRAAARRRADRRRAGAVRRPPGDRARERAARLERRDLHLPGAPRARRCATCR